MKEKETKKKIEELKDRKIDEEILKDVAGGSADTKPYKGGLSGASKGSKK